MIRYISELQSLLDQRKAIQYLDTRYYIVSDGQVYWKRGELDVFPIPTLIPVRLRACLSRNDLVFQRHINSEEREEVDVFDYLLKNNIEVSDNIRKQAVENLPEYHKLDYSCYFKNGSIYKITNTINGKNYIGQTVQKPYSRIQQHIMDAASEKEGCALWNALRKYGVDSFQFEILETGIVGSDSLDEAERKWIRIYDSVIWHGHGYNMTNGGRDCQFTTKGLFTFEALTVIKDIIRNTTLPFCELERITGYPRTTLSAINRGKIYFDPSENYPLRNPDQSQTAYVAVTNPSVFKAIEKDLDSTDLTIEQISEKYGYSTVAITNINQGNWAYRNRYQTDSGKYPLRLSPTLTGSELCSIVYDLITTSQTFEKLAETYKKTFSSIITISMGRNFKHPMLVYPLRDHSFENRILLETFGDGILKPAFFGGDENKKNTVKHSVPNELIDQSAQIIESIRKDQHPTLEDMMFYEKEGLAKPIPGYNGIYYADINGRVYGRRGKATKEKTNKNSIREYFSLITVKEKKNASGIIVYNEITLRDDDGNRKSFSLARVIAELFVPNPNKKKYVWHKNSDASDNRSSNLEWHEKRQSHTID